MVPQMHGGRHRQRESGDTVAMIEARIRRALRSSAGTSALSRQSLAAEPHRSERRAVAVRLMDARADLVGFRLSSRLKGVGRATTLVREGLRRGLLEVLFRQTEFNRSSSELIRAHEEQLEALGATVRAQIGIQLGVEERLEALEALVGAGPYCCGGEVTIADICLVPQVNNARRLKVPLDKFPKIVAIDAACLALPAFDRARPENQPDVE